MYILVNARYYGKKFIERNVMFDGIPQAELNEVPLMHTILVVDDMPQNLTILGELLQPFYHVRVASSGERALRAACSEPRPDLILLDVMMPEMNGYEVLRHLRRHEESKSIPVIFITAMATPEDEEHGLGLGAVDYITKPFNPSIVLARVRTHLELKLTRDRMLARIAGWRLRLSVACIRIR